MIEDHEVLLEVKNLKTHFYSEEGVVRAVDGVDFKIKRGQTVGMVGESGSGKSVTARSILQIIDPPGRIVDGAILYYRPVTGDGTAHTAEIVDLAKLDPQGKAIRAIRGGEISMVFQEPMNSLSPVHTLGDQIMEAIMLHQQVSKYEARERAIEMLNLVGMPQPSRIVDRYPYELSGGMRQRGMIAMALSCHSNLLIADEPTTALDVTTEAQILHLMRQLQAELSMAILFITHNLGVVAQMADYVIVMYLGQVVEAALVDDIFHNPKHPYTQALLKSIPRLGGRTARRKHLVSIRGTVPNPTAIPTGCPFHPRCDAMVPGLCDRQVPSMIQVGPEQQARCLLYGEGETVLKDVAGSTGRFNIAKDSSL